VTVLGIVALGSVITVLMRMDVFDAPIPVRLGVGVEESVNVTFSAWPQATRLRVQSPTQLVEFPRIGVVRDRSATRLDFSSSSVVFVPDRQATLAIDNHIITPREEKIRLRAVEQRRCDESVELREPDVTFVCRVEWKTDKESGSQWTVRLHGTLAGDAAAADNVVSLSIPAGAAALPSAMSNLTVSIDGKPLQSQYAATWSDPSFLVPGGNGVGTWTETGVPIKIDPNDHSWSVEIALSVPPEALAPDISLILRVSSLPVDGFS
jgi:hypothetical protein